MIMPIVTLAAAPIAILARYTRASMLDIRSQDYVRTARAKGLREHTVVGRHMLRNALLPIITVLGPVAAALITGSFVELHLPWRRAARRARPADAAVVETGDRAANASLYQAPT
jgi:ABC-type antimicrobial peptide transport system permease subunit